MKLLRIILGRSKGRMCIATVAGVVSGVSTTTLLVAVNQMMRMRGHCPPGLICTFAFLCAVRLLCGIASQALLVQLSQMSLHDLRLEMCRKLMSAPLGQIEQLGPSRLTTVFADDMVLIATALLNLPYVFVNIIVLAGCLIYLGWLSWQMLAGIGVCVTLGAITYGLCTSRANALLRTARQEHEHLFRHYRNLIAGVKELKLNAARRGELMDGSLAGSADRMRRLNTAGITVYSAAANWGRTLFFVYVGLLLWWPGDSRSLTELAASVLVILYMMAPLEAILNALPGLAQASVAVEKVESLQSLLDREAGGLNAVDTEAVHRWRELALIGVCHTYQDSAGCRPFRLGPIDLALHPGEITFIVGGNGSGKTTLGKLITSLYAPTSGEVCLDGEPLSQLGHQETRAMFAAVFNDFCLFDEMLGICPSQLTLASHYLKSMELDHKVTICDRRFSTTALSQGQRKRLALLVALLEDRPIYLFDEWAADQDPEFKELFYRQIVPDLSRRLKAVVVITHDDRYFDVADQLIRLDNGQLVASQALACGERSSLFLGAVGARTHCNAKVV